ncbi:hypothetical protein I302_105983 [Kwoniella bestiolae CBS 10118]|uniref:Myb-like domain-containing protein n=1 Tax=Kwoniella bestiolae CBS 10118 TaxID=1296100 RepID=A0A1B9G2P3_9TREE|nr:hypothetical protein I302_05107 [Kwoniella bestiolae CBS 10118]OCF25293.1 hypothetical protein I302_05107 [Kwoniella bestiolae CBS 10118]
MPIKRENPSNSDGEDDLKPLIETPTKKSKKTAPTTSPNKERRPWTESEELALKEAIHAIVKRNLWNEVKGNSELVKRGADGVVALWNALYKKM